MKDKKVLYRARIKKIEGKIITITVPYGPTFSEPVEYPIHEDSKLTSKQLKSSLNGLWNVTIIDGKILNMYRHHPFIFKAEGEGKVEF